MSVATRTPAAQGPTLLRRLFASLRSKPAAEPAAASNAGAPPAAAPAPRQLLAGPPPTLALASDATARPAEPQPAAKPRQISFMDPPAAKQTDRIFVIQDFIHRFRQVVAKQGITAKDPLAPVLEMLGEMLLHFTHLAEDQNTELNGRTRSMAAELRTAAEQVRGFHAEQIRTVERVMTRTAERVEAAAAAVGTQRAAYLETFGKDTEALFRSTVVKQTRVRVWTDRFSIATLMVVLAGGAYWFGRQSGVSDTTMAMRAAETHAVATLQRLGPKIASQWLDLADWNDLGLANRTCAPQADGGAYRLVCSYVLWSAPQVRTVPTAP